MGHLSSPWENAELIVGQIYSQLDGLYPFYVMEEEHIPVVRKWGFIAYESFIFEFEYNDLDMTLTFSMGGLRKVTIVVADMNNQDREEAVGYIFNLLQKRILEKICESPENVVVREFLFGRLEEGRYNIGYGWKVRMVYPNNTTWRYLTAPPVNYEWFGDLNPEPPSPQSKIKSGELRMVHSSRGSCRIGVAFDIKTIFVSQVTKEENE